MKTVCPRGPEDTASAEKCVVAPFKPFSSRLSHAIFQQKRHRLAACTSSPGERSGESMRAVAVGREREHRGTLASAAVHGCQL